MIFLFCLIKDVKILQNKEKMQIIHTQILKYNMKIKICNIHNFYVVH